jgi:hypothetical protein
MEPEFSEQAVVEGGSHWSDLANYAFIAIMIIRGRWPRES